MATSSIKIINNHLDKLDLHQKFPEKGPFKILLLSAYFQAGPFNFFGKSPDTNMRFYTAIHAPADGIHFFQQVEIFII